MNRLITFVSFIALFVTTPLHAQQFVAVKVEAENFSSKHADWRVTRQGSTPNVQPDPDGNHASNASGKAYVELLPDTRVTHGDRLITNGNFWSSAGPGPRLSYNVNIPEAGRYLVFAKAYSTGTEDNGIHVGIGNNFPASGQRMQWCSGKNKWTWSSAQRTSSNHCGQERTIYLDFNFAGANTVTFSAREDGFELDQFILLKTNNASCKPNDNDQIACGNNVSNVNTQPSAPSNQTPEPVQQPTPAPQPEPEPQPAPQPEPQATEPTIQPAPAPQPTPTVAPTPVTVVAPQSASPSIAICTSTSSDLDGDGWGWENQKSCRVAVAPTSNVASNTTPTLATCQSASSDQDGDGWGWENNRSCIVTGTAAPANTTTQTPDCQSAASDSDGDGWGWENNRSCIVR